MDDPKALVWLHGEIRTPPFSHEGRIEAGELLRRLQRGENLGLPRSRPMPSIGSGCHELRVGDQNRSWRIVYAIEEEAVVILEVFVKKTVQTPEWVIRGCRKRLRAYREL